MKGNTQLFDPSNSVTSGDIVFPSGNIAFFRYAEKRKDKDPENTIDIVAHGSTRNIQISINGKIVEINWRQLARLLKRNKQFKKRTFVRLLSCNTGSDPNGFAQNLANKLNTVVLAPNNLLWAFSNGTMLVAPRQSPNPHSDAFNKPHPTERGAFIVYHPGGNKNEDH